jgi:hypothetical protein
VEQLDGAAGLLAAQDADQPRVEATLPDDLPDDLFLAVAALEIPLGGVVTLGEVLGMGDEFVGFTLEEGKEVGAAHAEGMVHEAVEVGLVAEGEVSLEEDAIEAGQDGDKGRGELGDKRVRRLHGVLLRWVWLCNYTLPAERRVCFGLFGCGSAALGGITETTVCQRWKRGRDFYRRPWEQICTVDYDVRIIPDDWLAQICTNLRHKGNHRYAWPLNRRVRRHLPAGLDRPTDVESNDVKERKVS